MELIPPAADVRKDCFVSQTPEFDTFLKENYDFLCYGPSQTSIKMIDVVINSKSIPYEYKRQQLRHLIMQIYQEIALNEVQVTFWSILIEKYVWSDRHFDIRLGLTCSALMTREFLGDNIEYLLGKYTEKEDGFRDKYDIWTLGKNLIEITTKDIARQYKKLRKCKFNPVNYSFYVDEIILQYLPYTLPKKKKDNKIILPKIEGLTDEIAKTNEALPTLAQFSEELLSPLPLIQKSSSSGSKLSLLLSNNGSGCSQFLNFDV